MTVQAEDYSVDTQPLRGQRFIKYWSPARTMLVGLLAFCMFLVIAPLNFKTEDFSEKGLGFIALSLIGFWMGCAAAPRWKGSAAWRFTDVHTRGQIGHLIWITLALGAVGTLLRIYDRLVLRGFEFSDSMIWARESLQSSTSIYGYIGGLLFPLSLACLVLHWWDGVRRPLTLLTAAALAAYPLVEAFTVGSRLTFLHVLFLIAFCAVACGRLRMSHVVVALAVLGVPLLMASQVLFETRSMQLGYESTIEIYVLNSSTVYAPPQDWIIHWISAEESFFVDAFVRPWLHLSQYITVTWLIFMDNFTSFSGKIGWGQIHLAVPLRALGLVFDFGEVYDPTMEGMRDGLFSTAFSSIYYDFGWFGPAITFLFGYAATRLHAMAMREPHCWILLYGTVAFSCALAFVESQLLSGYFASAVWSFLLFALGASFWNSLKS